METCTGLDNVVKTAFTTSKSILRPTATIEVETPREYFTNGDIISGRLIVHAKKSFDVTNIQIKLRCEELVMVIIHNSNGERTEKERLRFLAPCTTVFPEEKLLENMPVNSEAKYTLGAGTHEFPFTFKVPESKDYPESWHILQAQCGVRWFIKATIHSPSSFSVAKRVMHEFEMRSWKSFSPGSLETCADQVSKPFITYLRGYAAHHKVPINLFRDMVSGSSEYKQETSVSLSVVRPEDGLPQSPKSLNVHIELASADDHLIGLRLLSIELKRKTKVKLKSITNVYRYWYPLAQLKINLPLKEANKFIETEIGKTTIKEAIPATLHDDHFENEYKFVVLAYFYSLEKPRWSKKLRISVPVTIRSHIPGEDSEGEDTTLPAYEAVESTE